MAPSTQSPQSRSTVSEMRSRLDGATHTTAENLQAYGSHYVAEPAKDVFSLLRDYAKDRPDVAAVWLFGAGVLVGWKLRG
ncbi:hypothetical protein [Allorhodopirellula heiligendammensis]|uniref:Uncharacterized protein n=1 Tax=Allorhodopirellula heiligendammensis TaxID=2714739 RepID=A0A5C6BY66_9BACT|nr:hypothetical protein [Allorhodopirellula heiligendammensis]TWU16196.1 hypothetical protein Poly21_34010 [Allorhodopirellula heiligendammensis]